MVFYLVWNLYIIFTLILESRICHFSKWQIRPSNINKIYGSIWTRLKWSPNPMKVGICRRRDRDRRWNEPDWLPNIVVKFTAHFHVAIGYSAITAATSKTRVQGRFRLHGFPSPRPPRKPGTCYVLRRFRLHGFPSPRPPRKAGTCCV